MPQWGHQCRDWGWCRTVLSPPSTVPGPGPGHQAVAGRPCAECWVRASVGGRANRVGDEDGGDAASGAGGLDCQTLHCLLLQGSRSGVRSWVDPGRRRGPSDRAGSTVMGRLWGAGPGLVRECCVDNQTESDPWCGEYSKNPVLQSDST